MKLLYYFNDFAGALSKEKQKALDTLLLDHSELNGYQNVVVIIAHRNGESLKKICFDIFNENKIGTKEENNGLLLVLVHEEKKIRIMTGKGIGYIFNDITCKHIIERKLRPLLNSGEYEKLIFEWIKSSNLTFKKEKRIRKLKKIVHNVIVILPFAPLIFLIQSPSLVKVPSFFFLWLLFTIFILLFRKFGVKAIQIFFNTIVILFSFYLLVIIFLGNYKEPGVACVNTTIFKECKILEPWKTSSFQSSSYDSSSSSSRSNDTNSSSRSSSSPSFKGGGGSTYGGGYGD